MVNEMTQYAQQLKVWMCGESCECNCFLLIMDSIGTKIIKT